MSLYEIAVKRPVAVSMIVLGVVVFGAIAYKRLPLNLMPRMSYPRLTVRTEYPGSGPEEIETELSRPIESILGTVSHLQRMTSRSRAGLSEVLLEFDWKVNMDLAMQEVREKLDLLRKPEDAKSPILLRYDPNLDPFMRLGLWGGKDLYKLRRYAEEVIRPALETLPGVAAVKIKGGLKREVEVSLDEKKISRLNLDIQKIVQRLKQENINLAGGRLKEGSTYYWVRTINEFRSLEEMGQMIIEERDGKAIRLCDVSTMRFQAKAQEVITQIDQQVSVELSIFREADANIVQVSQAIKTKIFGTLKQQVYLLKREQKRSSKGKKQKKSAPKKPSKKGKKGKRGKHRSAYAQIYKEKKRRSLHRKMTNFLSYKLPPKTKLQVLHDQATFIQASIDEVLQAALLGGGFAILILLLFLRNLWGTVIVGLSIPLSVIATFGGLYLSGVSLNVMSLGGLALGIGMLVDNSIVVLESIMRFREEGEAIISSAIKGVSEVGGAVTASTLTTVAVFFPIVFVKGVSGQLLRDLALTVVLSLLSSLVVSLFFIPMLSALHFSTGIEKQDEQQPFWKLYAWERFRAGLLWWWQGRKTSAWKKPFWLLFTLPWLAYLALTFALHLALDLCSLLWKLASWLAIRVIGLGWLVLGKIAKIIWAPIFWIMDLILNAFNWFYPLSLRLALNNRIAVFALCGLMGFGAYTLLPQIEREFMPRVHQGEFHLELTFPVGTPLKQTAQRLQEVESYLLKHPDVAQLTTTIGVEKTEVQNAEKGEHSATLTLKLKPSLSLKKQEEAITEEIRTFVQRVPGLQLKILYPSLFSLRTPIEIEIKGTNLQTLRKLSAQALRELRLLSSLRDIRSSDVGGLPEIQIHYDRERLLRYGISVQSVAEAVRSKVYGAIATRFRKKEKRFDVLVRVQKLQLKSIQELLDLTVHNVRGVPITLRQVAKLKVGEGPSQILRVSNQRAVLLNAELSGMGLGEAGKAIEEALSALKVPSGYDIGLSGQSEEMERSLNSLFYALLLSVFLVYLVMASQFESFLSPLIILGSVPLAFIGVLGFLWLFQLPISVMVFIGFIILTGIVVNNAIVLVDAIHRIRMQGTAIDLAIQQAGLLRLRPILMTTATTVLGLLPLALGFGEGSELRRPMAITIMAGLLFSTLLTLIVIPVLYRSTIRLSNPLKSSSLESLYASEHEIERKEKSD